MSSRVVFYQLYRKFVNAREDIPETARQVLYTTLAIGHHVGVLDCFSSMAETSLEEYRSWVESLPEGPGRAKLEGVLRWGEIEVNSTHVEALEAAMQEQQENPPWAAKLQVCLSGMPQEPALYLMVRRLA